MYLGRIIFVIAVIAPAMLKACMLPENVFGISFNNEEPLEFVIFEYIGQRDVNYKINYDDSQPVYIYKSHYDPSVLIELSASGMLFIIDTTAGQITNFLYARCVKTELDWLVEVGILGMDRIKRETIMHAFSQENASSAVYWTKQDTLLGSDWSIEPEGTLNGPFDCIRSGSADIGHELEQLLFLPTNTRKRSSAEIRSSKTQVIHNAMRSFDCRGRAVGSNTRKPVGFSGVEFRYGKNGQVVKDIKMRN